MNYPQKAETKPVLGMRMAAKCTALAQQWENRDMLAEGTRVACYGGKAVGGLFYIGSFPFQMLRH